MPILNATDDDLRTFIFNNDCVIVKYVKENCDHCRTMEPYYDKLSNDPKYKGIKFLRVDSGQNAVAHKEVGAKDMPFISIYKQGLLIECGSVRTEGGLHTMLDSLIAFTRKDSIS